MNVSVIAYDVDRSKLGRSLLQFNESAAEGYIEYELGSPPSYPYCVKIEPGAVAGNHWHKVKREAFVVLHGRLRLTLVDPNNPDDRDSMVLKDDGTVVVLRAQIAHAVENIGRDTAVLWVFATRPAREPDDDFHFEVVDSKATSRKQLWKKRLLMLPVWLMVVAELNPLFQFYKSYGAGGMEQVSVHTFLTIALIGLIWLIYGWSIRSWPLVWSNVFKLGSSGAVLMLYYLLS